MSAITDQQIADAQAYPPVAMTLWDPQFSWANQRSPTENPDNQGCPPGYGTVYTASGKACMVVSSTAADIQAASAPGWVDQSIIAMADASKAVVGGAGQVIGAVGSGVTSILSIISPWLMVGGLIYLYAVGAFATGRKATSYLSSKIPASRRAGASSRGSRPRRYH